MFFRQTLFIKLAILLLMVGFVFMPKSSSFFSDLEVADNNNLASGSLDMELVASPNPLNPSTLLNKGDSVVQEIKVKNVGNLPFQYSAEYVNSGGDIAFCNALKLKVENTSTILYNGLLSQLIPSIPPTPQTPLGNLNSLNEHSLVFTITLPSDSPIALSNKTCIFDFKFTAWQAELTPATTGFSDEETISGNQLTAADFTKPCVPVLSSPTNSATIIDDTPLFKWGNCTSENEIENYYLRIYSGTENGIVLPDESGYSTTISQYQASHLDDNHYFWQVRAKWKNGVFGDWSGKWQVTIDTTGPLTTLWAANSPERQIKEDVKNGEFDDGLNNWFHTGNVYVSQLDEEHIDDESLTIDYKVDPHDIKADNPGDNYNMVVIKPMSSNNTNYPDKSDDDFYYGMIQQAIPNSSKTLSFWFNFATMDTEGYDNPGLSVFINNQQIQQIWAEDINYPPETPYITGWHKFYFDISSIDKGKNPVLSLVFFSGNKRDTLLDSWVYVDKISTNDLIVNANTKIILKASDALSNFTTHYKIGSSCGGGSYEVYDFEDAGFKLPADPGGDKFCYWSEDEWKNKEGPKSVNFVYDNHGPNAISNLSAESMTDGAFKLRWTAEGDYHDKTNPTAYDIRYKATTEPTENEAGWNSMTSLIGKMTINAPRPEGAKEYYEVPIEADLSPALNYWFAIKTQDAAGNWSEISKIAHAEVEPSPSPSATLNLMQSTNLTTIDTNVEFKLIDDKKAVEFTATGISNWANLSYEILYNSDQGEQAIVGKLDINDQDTITKTDLKLGSSSTIDDLPVFIYNTGITKIKLTIILTGDGMPDRTLEKEIVIQ